ncbi:TRAP transporter permease [uncultured Selenomonas sp.]|uniref:TRAP transporter permease n=1 Tax=uncultured Selenomonas sp. TaxID=159275 RepID=UPI0028E9A12E|nr:TRAP transporter permease [uncultured Selenomonas sp.]
MTDHAANAEKVLKKYDRESNTAHYTGWPKKIIAAIAITFSVFQLYTAIFGVLDAQLQRAIHLGFGLALAYLLYPFRRAWTRDHYFHPIDIVFAVLGAATPAYLVIQYRELITRAGTVSPVDTVVGGLGILLVIEATRRVVGLPMVTVVLAFIAYAFLGPYMPGVLAHRGLTPEQLIGHLYFTTEGIFGIPLGVSSTFIFLFILFGAYLESTGLGKFFIDLANAVAGWASGGPAKVAVLSSGLMGTVSGSSVANVVGTGSLTIPMMKKLGYNANFAGAVEAAASTGGQLMPPVMGAAAFLMAEFVGVPYIDVVKAAAIPALLYFTGVWLGVHFEAKRKKLKGIPRAELPNPLTLLKERGHLAIPLVVIVYLLVAGYTPMRAALVAIFLSIICAMLRKSTRMKPIEIVYGLERGAKGVLGVLVACASAGIIIGVVTKTGVGLRLASGLIDLAGGMLLPAMFFTMITAIVLGMGVPTTANYVITSTIAAPALEQMGVPVLAAHMFVFYFGIIADVTPPVALAAYAGAGISGGNALKTGVHASKLAIAAFIIPYVFVLSPVLLMVDATPLALVSVTLSALLGMIAISSALCGFLADHCRPYERILLIIAGLLMIKPGGITDLVGLVLFVVILVMQYRRAKETA